MYLKLKTQYSFRHSFGTIPEVLDCLDTTKYAGICDRSGTWGHREWAKECKKRNIKPLFGVELAIVENMEKRERQPINWMSFIALNNEGLREIYELVAIASERTYYDFSLGNHIPRLDFSIILEISNNVAILSGDNIFVIDSYLEQLTQKYHFYIESLLPLPKRFNPSKMKYVVTCNNLYPTLKDQESYQIAVGDHYQLDLDTQFIRKIYTKTPTPSCNDLLHQLSSVQLPQAEMVEPQTDVKLSDLCHQLINKNFIHLANKPNYIKRLNYELDVVKQKHFEDYFLIVYDLVKYARENMLVGPARGSSCGSLICYILGITTVDPIKFDLLFERFIDINRDDLPDIDIDFPDDQRDSILLYLKTKYGYDNVAKLGTLSYFKPKSALLDTAKALEVPLRFVDEIKPYLLANETYVANDTVLKHSFEKETHCRYFLNRFPRMKYAAVLEGRIRHSGVHAAGIVVTKNPLTHYCSIDERTQAIQVDKYDAEDMGLLKIDALGLRTLSILNDVLKSTELTNDHLYNLPLDDEMVYDYVNKHNFSGIFQFEGTSLKRITSGMKLNNFEDIVALTSLCRPGPMNSGGTKDFLLCRTGQRKPVYINDIVKKITGNTYGVIVYQEQVMQIARQIGMMTWKDVSNLRRAVAKSKGEVYLNNFYEKFRMGAAKHGLTNDQTSELWGKMKTMGAYAFNRSHAVAYAMISYWCFYLKAKHPLRFACSTLRHAKDEDQTRSLLRELDKENTRFEVYNRELSDVKWQVREGRLIGGLTNIKGVGLKSAYEIIRKREQRIPFTARQDKLLYEGETPFDDLFECRQLWSHLKNKPKDYSIRSKIVDIENIDKDVEGDYLIICKITNIEKRQIDSIENIEKRGGRMIGGPQDYLVCKAHDDTDKITLLLGCHLFETLGRQLYDNHKEGDYYLAYGTSSVGYQTLNIKKIKKLTGNPNYEQQK